MVYLEAKVFSSQYKPSQILSGVLDMPLVFKFSISQEKSAILNKLIIGEELGQDYNPKNKNFVFIDDDSDSDSDYDT